MLQFSMGERIFEVTLARSHGLVSPSYKEVHLHPDGRWHLAHEALEGHTRARKNEPPKLENCLYEARGAAIKKSGTAMDGGALAMAFVFNGTLYAVVLSENEVVELHYLAVVDKHIAFSHADYPASRKGKCGVRDAESHSHGDESNATKASRRLLAAMECASQPDKVVEMVVVNDAAQYIAKGLDTEIFAAQVVAQASLLLAKLTATDFACTIKLRLVGMVTFPYGNPVDFAPRHCDSLFMAGQVLAPQACCDCITESCIRLMCKEGSNTCINSTCPNQPLLNTKGCYTTQSVTLGGGTDKYVVVHEEAKCFTSDGTNVCCTADSVSAAEVSDGELLAKVIITDTVTIAITVVISTSNTITTYIAIRPPVRWGNSRRASRRCSERGSITCSCFPVTP
jgi:hypothetical protein